MATTTMQPKPAARPWYKVLYIQVLIAIAIGPLPLTACFCPGSSICPGWDLLCLTIRKSMQTPCMTCFDHPRTCMSH